MTGVLRDSINGFDIPLDNLAAVGGYGDGAISQWTPEMWARFDDPAIVKFVIVVNPFDVGDILDIEQGASPISGVPGWVRAFNRPRRAPTLYVNRGNWPAVVAALRAAGLDPTAMDWWVATLDGTLNVYFGSPGVPVPDGLRVVAVQWKGEALTGGHFDESVILDVSWLGLPPPAQEVPDVIMLSPPPPAAGQPPQPGLFVSGHLVVPIPFDETTANLEAAGVKVAQVSQAFFDSVKAAGATAGSPAHAHFSSTQSSTTGGVVPGA